MGPLFSLDFPLAVFTTWLNWFALAWILEWEVYVSCQDCNFDLYLQLLVR